MPAAASLRNVRRLIVSVKRSNKTESLPLQAFCIPGDTENASPARFLCVIPSYAERLQVAGFLYGKKDTASSSDQR